MFKHAVLCTAQDAQKSHMYVLAKIPPVNEYDLIPLCLRSNVISVPLISSKTET